MKKEEITSDTEKFLLYCPNCDDYFLDNADFYNAPEGMKYAEKEIPICPVCGGFLE